MITDVANSSLRNAGTAKDVMKHIPGVIALKDKYEVFGKGSPIIYINNKKMRTYNATNECDIKNGDKFIRFLGGLAGGRG